MHTFVALVNRLATGVVRLVLGLSAFVLALVVVLIGLFLLVLVLLWALVRGRRPQAPVFVARFQRYAEGRVWPGRSGHNGSDAADVVDVEAHDVNDRRLPPGS